jgi:hypothetical protein
MNDPVENGKLSLLGSILLSIVSWFTPENIDLTLKLITGSGALIAAIFSARYYWYATKEKKKNLGKYD